MENDKEDLIQIGNNVYILTWDYPEKDEYRYRVKNSKNQTVELSVYPFYEDREKNNYFYTITLSVNKKGKGYEFGKETGKTGIESLLIAKKILKYHIDKFIDFTLRSGNYYFVIWWDDNRRRDVYYRGLKDLGFIYGHYGTKGWNSGKCLVKQIVIINE